MSANSDYNIRPSWIKDNISQILLLLVMLIVAISIVIYLSSSASKNSIFADNNGSAKPIVLEQPPAKLITDNWQEDPADTIENTQFSVGINDLNDKRIVISKEDLIGLEERYLVNVVDVATRLSAQQPEMPAQQNNTLQPSISIIETNDPAEVPMDVLNSQHKSFVNQKTGMSLLEVAQQKNTLELILTPVEILLAKPPNRFTLKLLELETQAQLLIFIGQHELPEENLYIYQKSGNKQPQFVIIAGQYESFTAAKSAQQSLSTSLLSLPSNIITYQEIHQDLQLNND